MDKLLNENKEPQDVISRNHDLNDGIEVEINLKDLYTKKPSKVCIFKKIHSSHQDSTFVDIETVREVVIGDTIEFDTIEDNIDPSDYINDQYNLESLELDLSDLFEESQSHL